MGRTRRKKSKKNKKTSVNKRLYIYLLPVFLVLCAFFLAYLGMLDKRIQERFNGNRWSLPARVYASPTEIYRGKQITPVGMQQILDAIGYSAGNIDAGSGRYRRAGNEFHIRTRRFTFWDGEVTGQKISVRIQDDKITTITAMLSGEQLAYFRLEPQLIGKIYPLHNQDRVLVAYDRVPQHLVDALIAVEDRSFFYHHGIDPKGILRAFIANLRSGSFVQGGSTLTQQLVKNFFLSPDRTLIRKINEMFMALILEYRYSKAEIMSAYINEVYLGQNGARGIHGFGTAAEFYFGKPLDELSTAQLAMLVGLVKGASYYNPIRHPQRAHTRRNLVLEKMNELGFISDRELKWGHKENLLLDPASTLKASITSDFLELVKQRLLQTYDSEDLQNEGLRIFTTLDPVLQQNLQRSLRDRLQQLEKGTSRRDLQAAAIVSTVDTGEIVALSGSRGFEPGGFNRAMHGRRPIGSLIKPFVYLTALSSQAGFHPLSLIEDAPIEIKSRKGELWRPRNYSGKSYGQVTILEALARSYNQASVNLGMQAGLKNVIKQLRAMGFNGEIKPYPSLLLGSIEMTPLEVTQLYQVLASGGFRSPLKVIREVLTRNGKPLQKTNINVRLAIKPEYAWMLDSMLRTVVNEGTARGLHRNFSHAMPLAGKTGTTNETRDSWFAGFGSNYLGVVWVGKDDNSSTGLTGAGGAMRLWGDIMQHISLEPLVSLPVQGIRWMKVKNLDGGCSNANEIAFLEQHTPDPALICH